jgi:2-isopropylmalate synthase
MKKMNFSKYVPYETVKIDRAWPGKTITKAPAWCSVDLRDGNQALSIPMNVEEKLEMFKLLVDRGFKEIEVGFPSASETEFRFVRTLIEKNLIPDGVAIQVLTQSRETLIRKTFEAIRGAKNAIVHLYNSTSTVQREVVFRKNKEEIKVIAVEGTKLVRKLADEAGNPGIRMEYSPESFTGTELDYALEVCHAVMDAWQPTPGNKIIFNLPATIEMSTPNVFADRIEWFCRNVKKRECATVCVHTHNDRGCAVAAAELAVMAGADRVEGALFGNGERCGNMDIITMALNLFSRGVDPELDLTDINHVCDTYTRCTRMPVHPRHPYAGELVYTAFSGSHQDAINKGMKAYAKSSTGIWNVPYLPIDPRDVGRTYESIIRINSQSGKGGVAYIMETEFGIQIPKWMQSDLARIIQEVTDRTGKELLPEEIRGYFMKDYIERNTPYLLEKCHIDIDDYEEQSSSPNQAHVNAAVKISGRNVAFEADGNGPVDAFVKGLQKSAGISFALDKYAEHALTEGSDSKAIAYIAIKDQNGSEYFGAGIDANISIASIKAVISALNRIKQG